MPDDRRTELEIRSEIAAWSGSGSSEAVADLRAGIGAKRRSATIAGAVLAAGLAAGAALKVVRRFSR